MYTVSLSKTLRALANWNQRSARLDRIPTDSYALICSFVSPCQPGAWPLSVLAGFHHGLLDELEHGRHRAASVGERLERHLDLATDFDLIGVGVEVDDVGLQTHAFRQIDLRQNQR